MLFTAEQKELIVEIVDRELAKHGGKNQIDWEKITLKLTTTGHIAIATFPRSMFIEQKSLKIGNFYLNTYRSHFRDALILDKIRDFGVSLI